MISTSSYKNWNSQLYRTCSISGDRGMMAKYKGQYYSRLAPKYAFWKVWKDNIGKIPERENNLFYIKSYYEEVLSKLEVEEVDSDIEDTTLLCYEDGEEFCHRHIVAAWIELLMGKRVPEQKANGILIEEVKRPEYIKIELEKVIKEQKNMRGFNSLRALHLFEKSEKLEQKGDQLIESGKNGYDYKQAACYLRCDADEAEAEYNARENKKSR